MAQGIDINCRDYKNRTHLNLYLENEKEVVFKKSVETLQNLINHKADLNIKNMFNILWRKLMEEWVTNIQKNKT